MKKLSGIIIGALIGITAGILIAPDKGTKTRKTLTKESDKWKSSFEKQLGDSVDLFLKNLTDSIDGYSKKSKKSLKQIRKKRNKGFSIFN